MSMNYGTIGIAAYNPGTCSAIVYNMAANGTALAPPQAVESYQACCTACRQTFGCNLFLYNITAGKTCSVLNADSRISPYRAPGVNYGYTIGSSNRDVFAIGDGQDLSTTPFAPSVSVSNVGLVVGLIVGVAVMVAVVALAAVRIRKNRQVVKSQSVNPLMFGSEFTQRNEDEDSLEMTVRKSVNTAFEGDEVEDPDEPKRTAHGEQSIERASSESAEAASLTE